MSAKLKQPWAEGRSETWIDGIKRAVRSRPESDIRRTLPLSPENVLALIYDAEEPLLKALKVAEEHLAELREAWQRGVISEHDGQGGTRSNRNVDVHSHIQKVITEIEKS